MNPLSSNFKRSEFACGCGCGFTTVDAELLTVLEMIRKHWNRPVIITSGCRCHRHNTYVTGNPDSTSKHIQGIAVDFYVKGISPKKIYNWLDNLFPDTYGIGDGSKKGFTHLDIRDKKARWSY